jgi:hypothetical protein
LLTPNGDVAVYRAYYHCAACGKGHFPFDTACGLQADRLSTGLRPLVCLAGALGSFRDAADDLLRRLAGVRLSASTVLRATERAGAQLQTQQQQGDVVVPQPPVPWDFTVPEHEPTAAYLGLDAFSVPIQQPGGKKAEGRMLYVGLLYTPTKEQTHYLVDFDLDRLAAQLRRAAGLLGLCRADKLLALSDAGNGLEAALKRNFWDDLLCILDWYHASQHLHAFASCLHPGDAAAARAWAEQAKGILYEQGGTALLAWLRGLAAPDNAVAADEWRKLVNYFADNEHRTDYPSYRAQGWDIGSGPTEAGCKVVGARLKQSGMRWVPVGAAKVAPMRALYESGPAVWDAFWAMAA